MRLSPGKLVVQSLLPAMGGREKDKKKGPRKDTWNQDKDVEPGQERTEDTLSNETIARTKENPAFNQYYRSQLAPLLENDAEWERFEACLRSPLPVTFRFSGWAQSAAAAARRDTMEAKHLPSIEAAMREQAAATEGPLADAATPLPWYPSRLAWKFDLSRAQLRGKNLAGSANGTPGQRSSPVKAFHMWLLEEQELGHVQRQEAVSMVPPLLLDVRPGQTVLDMCASPGSKTQQVRPSDTSRQPLYKPVLRCSDTARYFKSLRSRLRCPLPSSLSCWRCSRAWPTVHQRAWPTALPAPQQAVGWWWPTMRTRSAATCWPRARAS